MSGTPPSVRLCTGYIGGVDTSSRRGRNQLYRSPPVSSAVLADGVPRRGSSRPTLTLLSDALQRRGGGRDQRVLPLHRDRVEPSNGLGLRHVPLRAPPPGVQRRAQPGDYVTQQPHGRQKSEMHALFAVLNRITLV